MDGVGDQTDDVRDCVGCPLLLLLPRRGAEQMAAAAAARGRRRRRGHVANVVGGRCAAVGFKSEHEMCRNIF